MCARASCCLAGDNSESTILVSEGRLSSSSVSSGTTSCGGLLEVSRVPRGSCVVWKEMGLNSPEEAGAPVANAIL